MDALKHVLHAVRIKAQVYRRAEMTAPWQTQHAAPHWAAFHLIETGRCCLELDGEVTPLAAGDLVVVSNRQSYGLADRADSAPCVTRIIHGEFRAEQNIVYPIFTLLPDVIHIRNQDGQPIFWLTTALRGIASEAQSARPGYEAVISRLMDILFIMVMRSWIDQHRPGEGGWLGALYDPHLGRVLDAIHGQPDHPWTLDALARIAVMSRSAFVERFAALVGEPPMKYLTRWRVQLATTWLCDDDRLTVEQIALRLGYSSPFAFSKAFKRLTGVAPANFRRIGQTEDG